MGARREVFVAVLRSPLLRRVELAFFAFSIAEWATWVGMVVYAYGRGGAGEAGIVAAASLAPSLVVAPAASLLGDRYPRRVVLVGAYAVQGTAMALVAAALALGAPPLVVYVLAMVTATSITLTRPLQASLLPEVVTTPDELTAANVASGTVESAGSLGGPIVASVLVGVAGPGLVFGACGVAMLLTSVSLIPLARRHLRDSAAAAALAGDHGETLVIVPGMGILREVHREMTGGLAAIAADRRLVAVAALGAGGWFVLGALDIFYAVLAVDVLGLGDEGVGLLGAATGLGALIGAAISVLLVGRPRLAPAFVASSIACGLALAAIGLVSLPLAVGGLLVLAGAASSVLYVAGLTLTQRLAPPAVLTRVFGVLEAMTMGMTAVGSLAVPVLVAVAGPGGALIIAGCVLPAAAVLAARTLARADRTLVVPARELALLAGVPMFAPLGAPVLERLARSLVRATFAPGEAVIREGEDGDCFYVIAAGRAGVTIAGRPVRELGPGEYFGEIALLRDVPRTATVVALEALEAVALSREPFLEAITGQPHSGLAAHAVVEERLATGG